MQSINNSRFGGALTSIIAAVVDTTYTSAAWPDLVLVGSGAALAITLTIPDASGVNAWTNPATGQFRVINNSSYPVTVTPAAGSAIVGSSVIQPGSGATFLAVAAAWTNINSAPSVGGSARAVNSQSGTYAVLASDMGKILLHPAADNNARTWTIPANSAVPIPVGASFEILNQINTLTLAITTDTMTLYPANTTGSRTIAVANRAIIEKVSATGWVITGTSGVT